MGPLSRRALARGALGAAAALGAWARPAGGQARTDDIVQPPRVDGESFMRRAFEMRDLAARRGDQSFGAIVVRAGLVVGQAPSQVVTSGDPTAHAETEAIRDACRRLGTRDLAGAELYSSSRRAPCARAPPTGHASRGWCTA